MKSKAELVKRWGDILQETIEHIPNLYERYNDPRRNYKADFNPALHNNHRRIGVLDYLLNHNVISFKENLRKAVSFEMELLERYDKGEPIHPSRVSMTCFAELFVALASGDMNLAQNCANLMGGRSEAEEMYDDEFVLSLGYSLKYAIENNLEKLRLWLPRLKAFCENPKNSMSEFMGYPLVFEALLERDLEKANAAFQVLVNGHKKKCKSYKGPDYGPYFDDSPDADLFVWGIGLANLCRYYGLNVQISDYLIPEELLISAS